MSREAKINFFNDIASKWDGWEDLSVLHEKFNKAFQYFQLQPHEHVLDIGCGTGNLTDALLRYLSEQARVVAIDISPEMLAYAQQKIADARVTWHLTSADMIPEQDQHIDRIFCYSVWPHFDDVTVILKEFKRLLRPHGLLHIWHMQSRNTINEIHSNASPAVAHDVLLPADEIAARIVDEGFTIETVIDDDHQFIISAQRQ